MAKRVFQLAKELGVKSKDLLERCRAEGVPGMDNHMSTVSAGLEASIRGWVAADGPGGLRRSHSADDAEHAVDEETGATAIATDDGSGDDEGHHAEHHDDDDDDHLHGDDADDHDGADGHSNVDPKATAADRGRAIRKKAARKKAPRSSEPEPTTSPRERDLERAAAIAAQHGRIIRRPPAATAPTEAGEDGRSAEATSVSTSEMPHGRSNFRRAGSPAAGDGVTEIADTEANAANEAPPRRPGAGHDTDDVSGRATPTAGRYESAGTDTADKSAESADDGLRPGPGSDRRHGDPVGEAAADGPQSDRSPEQQPAVAEPADERGATPQEPHDPAKGSPMSPSVAAEMPPADLGLAVADAATADDDVPAVNGAGTGGAVAPDRERAPGVHTGGPGIAARPAASEQHSGRPRGEAPAATSGPGTTDRRAGAAGGPGAPMPNDPRRGSVPLPGATRPSGPVARPNVPERPTSVTPAGPMLGEVQQPAKLSGPKVVRVEQPDRVEAPRSRLRTDRAAPAPGGRGVGGYAPSTDAGGASRRNARRKGAVAGPAGGPAAAPAGREGRSGQSGRFAGGGGARSTRSWGEQDLLERQERLRGSHGFIKTVRRDARKSQAGPAARARSAKETGGMVRIEEPFSIKDLSAATGVRAGDILKALFKKGVMTNINAGIDPEMAMEIMLDWDIELDVVERKSAEDLVAAQFEEREAVDVRPRPPVVTILGHVDHGKTSLLDRIRHANVAAGEAGGITQHTSAFRISVRAGDDDKTIVFLDTPGHEAFTSMRARGAKITDMVVLVVAADDGVMPQTVESINHAKAAKVPIIVALNKIDKPEATEGNLHRIFAQLAEHDLSPVEWGGQTELVRCSAITGQGVQELLDTIDFQAQLHEFKADFGGRARGTVIEGMMVEGRGAVANVLIQEGHIKIGDFVVMGRAYGRVRSMIDDRGTSLREAGPATPLEISGLSAVPDAGDRLYVVESLRMAEEAAEQRVSEERERELATPKVTLDNIFSQIKGGERKELNLVVKADVQGSVETLKKTLAEIENDELNVRVLHAAVGGITESDILLAEASHAIVLGFHVIASAKAREMAEQKHVEVRTYQVIYELLDDVKMAAEGLLEPELREEVLGHAEVREVFKISKVGMIAGCYVTNGTIQRAAKIRVTRNDIVIENSRVLEQLKRFKDDAKEVRAGQECGMKIEGYDDIKPGDILECYKIVEIKRTL